jgi:hypothetical protein
MNFTTCIFVAYQLDELPAASAAGLQNEAGNTEVLQFPMQNSNTIHSE